jgi:hypothetical protein
MSKTVIGIIFIVAGILYGSMALDFIYQHTLGALVEHNWVKPPEIDKDSLQSVLGRKFTILVYALALIIIGLFILWNRTI